MRKFLNKIKDSLKSDYEDESVETEEYVELNTGSHTEEKMPKVIVRPFILEDFADVKQILDSLREGNTIAIVNVKPLKEKDLQELRRAITKIKATCTAISGEIAGFGDDYIAVVPGFATIKKGNLSKGSNDDDEI